MLATLSPWKRSETARNRPLQQSSRRLVLGRFIRATHRNQLRSGERPNTGCRDAALLRQHSGTNDATRSTNHILSSGSCTLGSAATCNLNDDACGGRGGAARAVAVLPVARLIQCSPRRARDLRLLRLSGVPAGRCRQERQLRGEHRLPRDNRADAERIAWTRLNASPAFYHQRRAPLSDRVHGFDRLARLAAELAHRRVEGRREQQAEARHPQHA